MKGMKTLDIVIWVLLAIGGLNWGMVGIFGFDLVEALFGIRTFLTRMIYTIVGIAAVYDIVMIKSVCKRWDMHFGTTSHA